MRLRTRALTYVGTAVVGFWFGAQTSARLLRPYMDTARSVIERGEALLEELEGETETVTGSDPLDGWEPQGFTPKTLEVLRGVVEETPDPGPPMRDEWA